MGRGRRAKLSDEFLATMVLEHHVDAMQIRKGGKGMGVTQVHHVQWGWMPVDRFYQLDTLHTVLVSTLPKIVEGAYRAKAAIYGTTASVSILGSEISIPLWVPFVAAAFVEASVDHANGHVPEAILDLLALGLPFGEVWTIVRAVQLDIGFIGWLDEKLRGAISPNPTGSGGPPIGGHR